MLLTTIILQKKTFQIADNTATLLNNYQVMLARVLILYGVIQQLGFLSKNDIMI